MSADLAALAGRIEALEQAQKEDRRQLQRLNDIEAIKQLKYRYFRALDSADLDLLRNVLTEDFNCHFSSEAFDLKCTSRDQFVELMANNFNDMMATQHHGHHPEINVAEDGKTATGTWYLQDLVHNLQNNRFIIGTSFYRDAYVRTAEGWKESSSAWERHVEAETYLAFSPRYTGRYLKNHGRKVGS